MADNHVMNTVVRLLGQIDPSLSKSVQAAEKQFKKMNKTAFAVNASFVAMGVAAVKATIDISKQLYSLGEEFDKVYDTIRVGTGATGEQLEVLKNDFKDVYSSVPTTMEDAGKAITNYNTRLGITGKNLSELSKQAIAVSGMMKEDLNTTIQNSSQAFRQWNISADDMGNKMDYVFKISQSTGMSFNQLMGNMKAVGPAMQQLGFTFEQSAAMMGQMEKAGINTDEALKAMKKSVGVFAKDGLNASKGFEVYSKAIKNAKTETEAISLASEVFGAKAGSTMANAIRKGALSIGEFTKALNSSDETIMKALWDTADATEKSKLLTQQIQTAVEPLASDVFDAAAQLIPILQNTLVPLLQFLIAHLNVLIPIIAGVVTGLGSFSILQSVITLMNLWKASTIAATLANGGLVAALKAVWLAMTTNPIGWICIAIGALIAIIVALVQNWDKVKEAMIKVWDTCKSVFGKLGTFLKEHFIDVLMLALGPIGMIIKGITTIGSKIAGMRKGQKATEDLPKLARGGFTNGVSIAGEAGREAVISFDPAYRSDNISTWLKAGQLLGVSSGGSNSYNLGGITYSPNLYFNQKMSDEDVVDAVMRAGHEFMDFVRDKTEELNGLNYRSASSSY